MKISPEEEERARKVCAWCNWVYDCIECPHRVWPDGAYLANARFDYSLCVAWKRLLPNFFTRVFNRVKRRVSSSLSKKKVSA